MFTTCGFRRSPVGLLPSLVPELLTVVPFLGTVGEMRRDDLRPALFGTAIRDRVLIRLALSENGQHRLAHQAGGADDGDSGR